MSSAAKKPSVSAGQRRALPEVWPAGQQVGRWYKESVFVTKFADHGAYHEALCRKVMALARDPATGTRFRGEVGSVKVYDVDKWRCPEADLVHARALHLFRMVTQRQEAVVDLSWASVYRSGDWCMPHSHPRTEASVLYVLDLGDTSDSASGRFCFADSRMQMCCREEAGYMSTPCAPPVEAGTMMLFPGQAIHFVTPYHGKRPRLTMSWNLNHTARAGEPIPEHIHRPTWD